LVEEQGWTDQQQGWATSSAMLVVAILGPWLGIKSDSSNGKKKYLLVTTLLCIFAVFFLGTFSVLTSVILFVISLVGFNLGSVVYDALITSVSDENKRGEISGLGVAFGYVGSLIGFGVAEVLLANGYSYIEIFRSVALLFLLFSIPAFLFIEEKILSANDSRISVLKSLRIVYKSWQHTREYKGLTRFLIGRFFYADAINTLISGLLAIYLTQEAGFSESESTEILGLAIIVSIIGGYIFGKASDIYGPRRLILVSISCWIVSLSLAIVATEFNQMWLIYVTAVLGGFNIGGIFAVDRVFMTKLCPEEHLGEFYGLYSTIGRFATILGPLLWGFIVNGLNLGRNVAMGSLIVLLAISYYIISGVSDKAEN
jgi:UMF1 family MFS transporter